jgi:EAL domain-containing protein (putative c-di-GMP-specific phosphodiesterase class I)
MEGEMAVLFRREKESPPVDPIRHPLGGSSGTAVAPPTDLTIEHVVAGRLVTAEFQPIVRLDTNEVVAFEAFARGPAGSNLSSPLAMFQAAEPLGLTAELDQVAHAAAYRQALQAKLHPSISLFVNADARQLGAPVPDDLAGVVALALARLRMLIEVSDRTLAAAPGKALAGIEKARASGWGIAWEDLGDTPDSLALMPFVRPDVVKINVGSAHDGFQGHAARVVNAAIAYAERSGASIMATGVETEAHIRTARGIGAVLAQGWHFGRPGPLPPTTATPHNPVALIGDLGPFDPKSTPYQIYAEHRTPQGATSAMLEAFAHHLEQRAAIDPEPPVILTSLPGPHMVSGTSLAALQMIKRNASFVSVVMRDKPAFEIPGVRVIQLAEDDPVRDEWTLAIVGPHFAALLTARAQPANRASNGYNFTYGLTYDRELVTRAARALLTRVTESDRT